MRLRLEPGDRVEVFHGVTGQPLPGGVRRAVDPRWRPRIAIVAPVKQEAAYLLEWIAYHRALGVDSFLIGDNGGTDRTSDLLQALDEAEIIQRLDWRGEKAFQLRFYMDAVPRLRGVCDVVSITDADEFLRPLNGRANIATAIAEIFSRPEVSAVGIASAVYGSSGRIEPGNGLVIERFVNRAPVESKLHLWVKSIVRPERFVGSHSPHVAKIADGEYVDDCGDSIRWGPPIEGNSLAVTESFSWNSIRVDHFAIKSRQEFETKARRGRAMTDTGRDDEFFAGHDRNKIFDPMPADLVDRTKQEMTRVRGQLERSSKTWAQLRHVF